MKSEKLTKQDKAARWYDDACGTAHALELVGERWSLLIVRELMFGPRRFGELKRNLAGISANVLTQRLAGLEAAGILVRRKLPPPASVQVYELTPWGYEAEEPIKVLGRWAARSADHDPTLPLSPASLMLSFRTMIAPGHGERMTVGFRTGDDAFVAEVADGGIAIRRAEPAGVDLLVAGAPSAIAGVVYLKLAPDGVGVAVAVKGEGLARFADLFHLPGKA